MMKDVSYKSRQQGILVLVFYPLLKLCDKLVHQYLLRRRSGRPLWSTSRIKFSQVQTDWSRLKEFFTRERIYTLQVIAPYIRSVLFTFVIPQPYNLSTFSGTSTVFYFSLTINDKWDSNGSFPPRFTRSIVLIKCLITVAMN
jgi:hypothetical protein